MRSVYRDSARDQGDGGLLFAPLSFIIGGQGGGYTVGGGVWKSAAIFLVFKESCGENKQMGFHPGAEVSYQNKLAMKLYKYIIAVSLGIVLRRLGYCSFKGV